MVVGKNAGQEHLNSLNLLMAFILLALNTLDSLQVGKALQFLLGCLWLSLLHFIGKIDLNQVPSMVQKLLLD